MEFRDRTVVVIHEHERLPHQRKRSRMPRVHLKRLSILLTRIFVVIHFRVGRTQVDVSRHPCAVRALRDIC